jgi:hypothetical protein
MKTKIIFFATVLLSSFCNAQTKVNVQDINNFWVAYDSVNSTKDIEKQKAFIQKLYIDPGSEVVKYLISFQGAKAMDWVKYIANQKEKLEVIRPYTLNAINQKPEISSKLAYFKSIYPAFVDGEVFIVMGTGVFGGRPNGRNLVIGAEICANSKPDWAVNMVLHEYVHCQQKLVATSLLSQTIIEGMADFVAELVDQKPLALTVPSGHNAFGLKNEKAIWVEYKKYMGSEKLGNTFDWLYGTKGRTINGVAVQDLGYFMGYVFCKSYYEKAPDKTMALSEMINYDFSSNQKAKEFMIKSGYGNADDQDFIKNLVFGPVKEIKKELVLKNYGIAITEKEVVFNFKAPSNYAEADIQAVTVAGQFNGWNPQNKAFDMIKTGQGYLLTLPISNFEKSKTYEFKFVINRDQWQNIPEDAKNTKGGNLTFQIN